MLKLDQSWKRVGWLIWNDLRRKRKLLALIFLMTFGYLSILFLDPSMSISSLWEVLLKSNAAAVSTSVTTTTYYSGSSVIGNTFHKLKFHIQYFPAALFIVGFIVTSISFMEYGDIRSTRFHMTIPAKLGEKWISKLIITTIIFPLFFLCLYQCFAVATYHWGATNGLEYVKLPFFDPLVWQFVGLYMVSQCFVFLFAVIYRKYSFVKLILTYMGLYFLCALVLNLSLIIMLPEMNVLDEPYNHNLFDWSNYLGFLNHNVKTLSATFSPVLSYFNSSYFMVLAVVVALLLSFMRFKELEA